jgi:hypothetical protein
MSAKHSQIRLRHGTKFRDGATGIQSRHRAMERRASPPVGSAQSPLPVHPVKSFSCAAKILREHQRGLIFLHRAFFVALLLENRP